jgi:hypothetical protein
MYGLVVRDPYLSCLVSYFFILYKSTMKNNLCNVALGATIVAGVLLLTTANIGKASATAGSTTLTGTACNDTVAVSIYDIDFGSYSASDVLGTTKVNAGTKWGTSYDPDNGSLDYYVRVTNTCHTDNLWNVTISATTMTGNIAGGISNTGQFFSGVDTIFLFNGTASNSNVTGNSYTATTDLSANRTVLSRWSVNNGLAGYYGRLFTHTVLIPSGYPVQVSTGQINAACNSC